MAKMCAHTGQETLNARSEYTNEDSEGGSHHHINQYAIGDEIGRGSYGAVHLATDQFGNEYVGHVSLSDTTDISLTPFRLSRLSPRRGFENEPSPTFFAKAQDSSAASPVQGLALPIPPGRATRTSALRRPRMHSTSSARRLPS